MQFDVRVIFPDISAYSRYFSAYSRYFPLAAAEGGKWTSLG